MSTPPQTEAQTLAQWQAGEVVSLQSVTDFGLDNCFAAVAIDSKTQQRIAGKSFKNDCTTPRSELRYLKVLHYDIEKKIHLGELICHHSISDDLLEIFRTLFDEQYPIERMVLIDNYDADDTRSMEANNSSAFNFRFVAGTKRLSKHSQGMAVDINPRYNPYVKTANGKTIVDPASSAAYVDRKKTFPYKIERNDRCCQEFLRHGFEWGGDWTSLKDYQHFEKIR